MLIRVEARGSDDALDRGGAVEVHAAVCRLEVQLADQDRRVGEFVSEGDNHMSQTSEREAIVAGCER